MTKRQDDPGPTRADARRQAVIDAAKVLFVRQGFHQTGIAQIADDSGVKVGQIYRDFESKEAIIAAICADNVSVLLSNSELFHAGGPSKVGDLARWVDDYVALQPSLDECRILTEIGAEAGRNPKIAALVREIETPLKDQLGAALARLAPAASQGDPRADLVDFMFVIIMGGMMQRAIDPQYDGRVATRLAMKVIAHELAGLDDR